LPYVFHLRFMSSLTRQLSSVLRLRFNHCQLSSVNRHLFYAFASITVNCHPSTVICFTPSLQSLSTVIRQPSSVLRLRFNHCQQSSTNCHLFYAFASITFISHPSTISSAFSPLLNHCQLSSANCHLLPPYHVFSPFFILSNVAW